MSRIYVLQLPILAVAAARMKADVNFIGVADLNAQRWMEDNHVFFGDVWEDGEMTVRRIQRLYHRLFPGDILITDLSLPKPLLLKAMEYARERGTTVILCVKEGEKADRYLCKRIDLLVNKGGEITGTSSKVISVGPEENMEALVGALALCVMNGLSSRQASSFIRRAAVYADLPWYDEVAYAQ